MLTYLHIRNFAIVADVTLELAAGMSAMTGETGAGKSIVVDALSLLLGDRADSDVVRAGADQAEISAVFDLTAVPKARAWLAERDLGFEQQDCHLRRTINRNGRSRTYIAGSPQPLLTLKELGELLIDIHGQHEHQSLLKRDGQRQLLDDYAANQSLLSELSQSYQHWNQLHQALSALQQASGERSARLDWLRYQIRELEALSLQAGELEELQGEHRRLANAGRFVEGCQRALGALYESESSVQGLLSQTLQALHNLRELDAQLGSVADFLNSALIQVDEASAELRHYLHGFDLDPSKLASIEHRLASIHDLARKHRVSPEQLNSLLECHKAELEDIENSDQHHAQLEQQLAQASRAYHRCAEALAVRRTEAAAELGSRVSEAMAGLGMPGGRFEVILSHHGRFSPSGLETVEFLVSANPGQPLRPLVKVASGGELSRISLAIQVIAAHVAPIPTLIFDEVDTGIGGAVAEMVGQHLRKLAKNRQIVCVTHLAQVAVHAQQHFKVSKHTEYDSTHVQISALNRQARVEEIARMLGGLAVTSNTRAHAREMLDSTERDC